jgi:hypothetical protein
LELSFDVIQGNDLVVAVFCNEASVDCPSIDIARGHEKVERAINLQFKKEDGDSNSLASERFTKILDDFLPNDDDFIDVIIVDLDFPEIMSFAIAIILDDDFIDDENVVLVTAIDSKKDVWRRIAQSTLNHETLDPVFRSQVLLNTTTSSLELGIVSTGDEYFIEHLMDAISKSQEKSPDVSLEIRNVIGGKWRSERKLIAEDSEFSQIIVEDDYNNDDAKAQLESESPLASQRLSQFTNCEIGTYDVSTFSCKLLKVKKEDMIGACSYAFMTRPGGSMQVYENIGGDGVVCAGVWDTGTGIVSWDGRYQVDVNVWSFDDMEKTELFGRDVATHLPTLVRKLNDYFPRGYGRVVSFNDDLISAED